MTVDLHFDYDAFYPMLLDATRQALTWEKAQHADETFYAFGLYAAAGWGYLVPFCCTEEALTRIAKASLERYGNNLYRGMTLDEMRLDLRFSLADSPYARVFSDVPYKGVFEQINGMAGQRAYVLGGLWMTLEENEAAAIIEPEDELFKQVCYRVLRQLDSDGLFGTGVERDTVTVICDDGNYDLAPSRFVDSIRELNPPNVFRTYEVFRREWLALLEKREAEKRRGRSKD